MRTIGLTPLLDQLIDRLRSTLRDYDQALLDTMDRTGFHYDTPGLGLVEWMPAMDVGRRVSIKTVGYHPSNPTKRGTPSVLATTSVYDTTDGRLLLICEATVLTALRTGAASALATEVLSRPEASVLGMVGCGAQAVSQIHAISRVRDLRKVIAYDRSPAVRNTLEARLKRLDLDIDVQVISEDGLGTMMADIDILCTATTVDPGQGPVVPESEYQPWLHINAIGADFPGKLEIPLTYLEAAALVCPDVPAQCLLEGESQQLSPSDLGPELPAVVRNSGEFRRYQDLLTVFDSTGWALQDLVVAELIDELARKLGVGLDVDLLPTADDPYDPYLALDLDLAEAPIPAIVNQPFENQHFLEETQS